MAILLNLSVLSILIKYLINGNVSYVFSVEDSEDNDESDDMRYSRI
jgi:hypothetical protein